MTEETEPGCFARLFCYLLKLISKGHAFLVQIHAPLVKAKKTAHARKMHLLTGKKKLFAENLRSIVIKSKVHKSRFCITYMVIIAGFQQDVTLLRLFETTRGYRYLVYRRLEYIAFIWVTTAA